MLALEDLKGYTQELVKEHLINEYTANCELVQDLEVLIAYESVGSWGCDSSSFFLLKDKEGKLYEVHGSHCSCFGFEDQFTLQESSIEALKFRVDRAESVFYTGGYDSNGNENTNAVNKYILEM